MPDDPANSDNLITSRNRYIYIYIYMHVKIVSRNSSTALIVITVLYFVPQLLTVSAACFLNYGQFVLGLACVFCDIFSQ